MKSNRLDTAPVKITETVLRDAHQSLLATRMRTEDMLPILDKLDRVGYWSVEMWGGATFDSCLRFLREDPWERLRSIREKMPNTKLQMLLRGQNLVGYKHYPDDIVRKFIRKAAEYGIDVFRIFDALNDIRNMRVAIETALEMGKIVEGAISYTVSPFHTVERFVELAKQFEQLGCQVICIKDMAGLLSPMTAQELVSALKDAVDLPIHLHSHSTSGMAEMSYLKAIEAGVDIVDTAISSMSGGSSQPSTESLVASLAGSERSPGLDLDLLAEIAEYFRHIREKYSHFESKYTGVDPKVLRYQIPGGMISNLANQLREQGALDRMAEVLEEVPRVREDLGYPPLVTPTSQIVGTQAVLNVLTGERYKVLTRETRKLLLGYYGRTPAPVSPDLRKKAEELEGSPAIECRPADLLKPIWEDALRAVERITGSRNEDDALSYAIFPQVAEQFFRERMKTGQDPETVAAAVAAIIYSLRRELLDREESQSNGKKNTPINPWRWAARLEGIHLRLPFPQ